MNIVTEALAGMSATAIVRYTTGECETRPWGTWEVLTVGVGYILKRVVVTPGRRLSLQYHNHHAEHWTIVQGTAIAEIDGVSHILQAGEYVYAPLGARHRIANQGTGPMTFIEVQVGNCLDEQDIIRINDDYGRN